MKSIIQPGKPYASQHARLAEGAGASATPRSLLYDMVASIRKRNTAPKAFAAVLAIAAAGLATADEPSWPADFYSSVAAHVAATTPSGVQSGTATHVQPVSVVPSVTKESNGGNVSSWPTGTRISFH